MKCRCVGSWRPLWEILDPSWETSNICLLLVSEQTSVSSTRAFEKKKTYESPIWSARIANFAHDAPSNVVCIDTSGLYDYPFNLHFYLSWADRSFVDAGIQKKYLKNELDLQGYGRCMILTNFKGNSVWNTKGKNRGRVAMDKGVGLSWVESTKMESHTVSH